ncbi:MAG: hypothetical protein LBI03_05410 [Clostridiales bacterium]|nr:hypothetical protein [Clostridiales bacterium]
MNAESMSKRFAYIYKNGGSPIYEANQMISGKHLQCNPLNKEWQDRINATKWWATGYSGPKKVSEKKGNLLKNS